MLKPPWTIAITGWLCCEGSWLSSLPRYAPLPWAHPSEMALLIPMEPLMDTVLVLADELHC